MSGMAANGTAPTDQPQPGTNDMKLEVVTVPVSDVDRAKQFYASLGWREDADFPIREDFRVVQLTPPGSACSVAFGRGISSAEPGSVEGLQLVVDDVEQARGELAARGVAVSEVQTFPWGSFVYFQDPDGNGWAVQQLPSR